MERRRLTKEDLERAEVYIPLAKKYAIAQVLAPGCVEKAEGTPPIWQENTIGRKLTALYILTGFYLGITDTSGLDQEVPDFQFALEDFDRLSGLARELNASSDEKSAEILWDFEVLMDMLNREVQNILARNNDILARLGELTAMGATPEVLQLIQKELEEVNGEGEEK